MTKTKKEVKEEIKVLKSQIQEIEKAEKGEKDKEKKEVLKAQLKEMNDVILKALEEELKNADDDAAKGSGKKDSLVIPIKESFWCKELNKSIKQGTYLCKNAEEVKIIKKYIK